MKPLITTIVILLSSSIYAQEGNFLVNTIEQNTLRFSWGTTLPSEVILEYGTTKNLELGSENGLELTSLSPATFYYVRAKTNNRSQSETKLFSTASRSSGDITIYFNQPVDNNASSIANAIQAGDFEDTLVAYINQTQNTLDICNYNTGSTAIVNAVNTAETRGVVVRYIAADNTGTNNTKLGDISINMIQRPNDGEVMHNKFIISDIDDPAAVKLITGSANHTNNSLHNDYNNLVIIEDQSLALAYKTEFEEMWGSTGALPNLANSKFGADKADNTPHNFNIGGIPVELYFSPSDGTTAKIETAILSANTDMQFALLTYINNTLGDAVISIQNSGIDTKGIIENTPFFGSEYNKLQNAGVDVYSHFSVPNIFHHKYGIVDANNIASDPLVITGSHNWTNSAEDDNDENTLIIHDAEIANMYYEEFMYRYAEITGTVGVEEFEVSKISLYPNPNNGEFTVQSEIPIKELTIFNAIGQEVYRHEAIADQTRTFDLRFLEKGVYFLKAEVDNQLLIKKLLIE